ncbi:MAG: hypothetical protein EOP88_02020 [Verrucomicrobiaceae bacterium]|nr:MAG: hypothetical protein EOP88_02020 [Verrucomicrobiaceae bacterium]
MSSGQLAAFCGLAVAALAQQSKAAVTITGTAFPFSTGSNVSSGTIARITGGGAGVTQGTSASTNWFTNYNITNLDLAGDGTANDTISIRLNASAVLGSAALAGSARTWQNFSSYIAIAQTGTTSTNRQTQWDGDGMTFSLQTPTIVLGDNNLGISISDFALTGIGIGFWGPSAEQISLNGVTHTYTDGASQSRTLASPSQSLTILNIGGTGDTANGSAFVTQNISFSMTVIPEPSVFTLCGVMALGAVFRRSRKS